MCLFKRVIAGSLERSLTRPVNVELQSVCKRSCYLTLTARGFYTLNFGIVGILWDIFSDDRYVHRSVPFFSVFKHANANNHIHV